MTLYKGLILNNDKVIKVLKIKVLKVKYCELRVLEELRLTICKCEQMVFFTPASSSNVQMSDIINGLKPFTYIRINLVPADM